MSVDYNHTLLHLQVSVLLEIQETNTPEANSFKKLRHVKKLFKSRIAYIRTGVNSYAIYIAEHVKFKTFR